MRIFKKIILIFLAIITISIIGGMIYLNRLLYQSPHLNLPTTKTNYKVTTQGNYTFIGHNFLFQVEPNLYVMYIEGEPFERGKIIGQFTADLHLFQEQAFVNQLKKMIPNDFYLHFLKYFIAFFNRDIEQYIPEEYLHEIYGESLYMSSGFDELIGPPYIRLLNYHAAHDMGHALQDKNFVAGCTSFSAWGQKAENSLIYSGRNFDFYVGDDFAKNKIIAFFKPTTGIPFGMVTWPGMIGAVSGMNVKGISVTINASKSTLPTEAKTPISILTREILQYASNIDQAIQIAKRTQLFVSESILVTSGHENRAIIIEKSPEKMDIYESQDDVVICPNHFQSNSYVQDTINLINIATSSSKYRLDRMSQLIKKNGKLNPNKIASILRDPYGMDNVNIGWGNEKAIDQLIAHHSIIFSPKELNMWVSTAPFQLGKYICFNLDSVFNAEHYPNPGIISKANIAADSFLIQHAYVPYMAYKKYYEIVQDATKKKIKSAEIAQAINKMLAANPYYYAGYEAAGDYYAAVQQKNLAAINYQKSLSLTVTTKADQMRIEQSIQKLKRQ